MPGINIYLDEKENTIVNEFKELWEISKQDVIKNIIRQFKEDNKGDK